MRLRTLLLVIGGVAIPLAAIHYGWIEPLTLFPFLFAAGVAGGIALSTGLLPERRWAPLPGAMLGGGLATVAVVVVAVTVHARDTSSLPPAIWAGTMMFLPAAFVAGVGCLGWEAFWKREQRFMPRFRKRG